MFKNPAISFSFRAVSFRLKLRSVRDEQEVESVCSFWLRTLSEAGPCNAKPMMNNEDQPKPARAFTETPGHSWVSCRRVIHHNRGRDCSWEAYLEELDRAITQLRFVTEVWELLEQKHELMCARSFQKQRVWWWIGLKQLTFTCRFWCI